MTPCSALGSADIEVPALNQTHGLGLTTSPQLQNLSARALNTVWYSHIYTAGGKASCISH